MKRKDILEVRDEIIYQVLSLNLWNCSSSFWKDLYDLCLGQLHYSLNSLTSVSFELSLLLSLAQSQNLALVTRIYPPCSFVGNALHVLPRCLVSESTSILDIYFHYFGLVRAKPWTPVTFCCLEKCLSTPRLTWK